jgi:hypothetical protein
MNWNLEKQRLLAKDRLDDVSSGQREKLVRAMKDIPVARMIDAVNYIDKNLLPAVKKKSGGESADYKFFTEVVDYLLWCIVIVDRYESLEARWYGQRLEVKILREHLELMERELAKYNGLEDLYLASSMDIYAERVKRAAEDRLKKENKLT